MSAPRPWLDGGAPAGATELLEAARPASPLDPGDKRELFSAIQAKAAAPAATLSFGGLAKIIVGVVGGGGAIAGAAWLMSAERAAQPELAPGSAPSALAAPASIDREKRAAPGASSARALDPSELALEPPSPDAAPAKQVARPPAATGLAEELALLEQGRAALVDNPARALEIARQHAATFRRPQLVAERETIAVQALVNLGQRDQARARAERFIASNPNSLYGERLRQMTE